MHLQSSIIYLAGIIFQLAVSQDTPLPTCYRDSRLSRAHRLEGIKLEILRRLGLETEPYNPHNATEIKDSEFLEKYELVKESWKVSDVQKPPCASLDFRTMEVLPFRPTPTGLEKFSPSSRTADNAECPNDVSVEFNNIYRIKFFIDLRGKDFVTDAQLRLRKSRLIHTNINIEDQIDLKLLIAPEDYYGEIYPRFITSERLRADSVSDMLVFNVSKAIGWWLDFNRRNQSNEIAFEIHIRCSQTLSNGARYAPNFQFFSESNQDARLVITTYQSNDVFSDAGESRRKKRSGDQNFCSPDQIECCLNELEIDFRQDFNWTWVIKPKKISFNYCSGECPLRWGRSTKHSQLLERFRNRVKKNPAAAAHPCCVPNRYDSVTLLLYLNGVHRMDHLEDIIASSCACR